MQRMAATDSRHYLQGFRRSHPLSGSRQSCWHPLPDGGYCGHRKILHLRKSRGRRRGARLRLGSPDRARPNRTHQ
jgi:hypothetical protein